MIDDLNIPSVHPRTQLFLAEFYFACMAGLSIGQARIEAYDRAGAEEELPRKAILREAATLQIVGREAIRVERQLRNTKAES